MLDAIMSPAWDLRYYSFDSRWADGQMMASMRNGSGDHWFALLAPAGIALHGLVHEASNYRQDSPWPGLFDGLPLQFHSIFLEEPAFDTANSTFCLWRQTTDNRWHRGPVRLPPGDDPDGSAELLDILAGDPQQYVRFAADYYERDIAVEDVASIYRHERLTADRVRRLNPDVSLGALAEDADEIGYPEP
jgi:hypothetical protein